MGDKQHGKGKPWERLLRGGGITSIINSICVSGDDVGDKQHGKGKYWERLLRGASHQ